MSTPRARRINKELAEIQKDVHSHVKAEVVGGDLTKLRGSFEGPPGSPYEGGTFVINIDIPNEYPFRPPVMKFATRVWHPNISSQTGAICLDTLGTAWSPVLNIKSALLSLQSLLSTPEPKDPQDAEVATMLIKNPKQFARVAREWAVKYAGAPKSETGEGSSGPLGDDEKDGQDDADLLAAYDGYNKNLVDRFTSMGFDVKDVVSAFRHVGIHRMDGQEYELEEAYMNSITERLLG